VFITSYQFVLPKQVPKSELLKVRLEKKQLQSANLRQAAILTFNHVTIRFAICHFLFGPNSQPQHMLTRVASVVWWWGVGLVIERSRVRLPVGALPGSLG